MRPCHFTYDNKTCVNSLKLDNQGAVHLPTLGLEGQRNISGNEKLTSSTVVTKFRLKNSES